MKLTITSSNITHSLVIPDDSTRGETETVFKRLMMCVGFSYSDTDAQEIILNSDKMLLGE